MKAGSSSDYVSGFEDWLPTILDAVDSKVQTPDDIDGVSIMPTLLGESQKDRPFLYREFTGYGGQQTIRVGDWKAVRQNLARGKIKTELYNIATDIGEKNDVAAANPEVLQKLEALMAQQHVPSEVFPMRAIDGGQQ